MNDSTDFLYPFIESNERDVGSLLVDLSQSARSKAEASGALRATTLERSAPVLTAAAAAMAERLEQGARMFCFGNGGSSTDASSLADLFSGPPWGRPIAARSLVEDAAILTALGNDIGFDVVFSRQLLAHARTNDIAVGFSTSGNSRNLLAAFATAAGRGLLTIGFAGYGGGDMARSADVRHCLIVDDASVHRIQEAQAALGHELWRNVQAQLATALAKTPVAHRGLG